MSAKTLRKAISYIIPPVITVGLCYVLYSGIDMAGIVSGARLCNPLLVCLFLLCNVLAMVIRGLRWRLQLRAIGVDPGVGAMSRSIFGTYAVNLVFPRMGEFWRCAYIARLKSAPFSSVFGTMVADRLSDTLMVALISLPAFIFSSSALSRFLAEAQLPVDKLMSWPLWCLAGLCLPALLYLALSKGGFAVRARGFIIRTWRGFVVIFRMPHRLTWLALTLGIWGFYLLGMWISMEAYPPLASLVETVGAESVLVTFVFGSLAMAIPSNGGIGPWQFAIVIALSGLYGLPREQALVFATLNLGATTLLTVLLGLASFVYIAVTRR